MIDKKLAIFSPAADAKSETFIQSHRKLNKGEVCFYYGGLGNIKLDGVGAVQSYFQKAFWRILGNLLNKEKFDIRRSLKSSFRSNNIGAVLIEYGTLGAELLPYLDFFKGRLVVHFHGYDASSYRVLRDYQNTYRDLFDRADSIVVVSKKMKETILQMGADDAKVVLNTYGPHPDFFSLKPNYYSKQLIYIGRFVDKKAPYYLVLLMKELVRLDPAFTLRMIGEGPLLQTVRDLIKAYQLENNVFLEGAKSRNEILSIMSASCCYVQHSVRAMDGDMEGTPNSILEASAAGLPVISTFHAGIPDVVLNHKTGVLVDEHDIEGMIRATIQLVNDPNKMQEMGEAGQERIMNDFTQEAYLNNINHLF